MKRAGINCRTISIAYTIQKEKQIAKTSSEAEPSANLWLVYLTASSFGDFKDHGDVFWYLFGNVYFSISFHGNLMHVLMVLYYFYVLPGVRLFFYYLSKRVFHKIGAIHNCTIHVFASRLLCTLLCREKSILL